MKKQFFILLALMSGSGIMAQKNADRQNIADLCGCFDVQFKYAETFAPDEEYKYHNREIISNAREFVVAIEESPKKIVLQHLLIVSDTVIIKHWREDWTYENPVLFRYTGDKAWVKEQFSARQVRNKWTQSVWEVSDAPRYQGISEWVTTDGKTFWQNTTDAPLPRREYTKRKDYNVLNRTNRIIVDKNGWIHDQDNRKIARKGNADSLIAEEKGVNIYARVADDKCAQAKTWWENNKVYWSKVRTEWERYLQEHPAVVLKDVIDGKPMYAYLNDLEEQYANKTIASEDISAKIKETLDLFVSSKLIAQSKP